VLPASNLGETTAARLPLFSLNVPWNCEYLYWKHCYEPAANFMAKILQLVELFQQVRNLQFLNPWMTLTVLQLCGNTKERNPKRTTDKDDDVYYSPTLWCIFIVYSELIVCVVSAWDLVNFATFQSKCTHYGNLFGTKVQVHLVSIKAGFTVCQLHLACIKYQNWASFVFIWSSDLLRSMRL